MRTFDRNFFTLRSSTSASVQFPRRNCYARLVYFRRWLFLLLLLLLIPLLLFLFLFHVPYIPHSSFFSSSTFLIFLIPLSPTPFIDGFLFLFFSLHLSYDCENIEYYEQKICFSSETGDASRRRLRVRVRVRVRVRLARDPPKKADWKWNGNGHRAVANDTTNVRIAELIPTLNFVALVVRIRANRSSAAYRAASRSSSRTVSLLRSLSIRQSVNPSIIMTNFMPVAKAKNNGAVREIAADADVFIDSRRCHSERYTYIHRSNCSHSRSQSQLSTFSLPFFRRNSQLPSSRQFLSASNLRYQSETLYSVVGTYEYMILRNVPF